MTLGDIDLVDLETYSLIKISENLAVVGTLGAGKDKAKGVHQIYKDLIPLNITDQKAIMHIFRSFGGSLIPPFLQETSGLDRHPSII